MIKLIDLHKVPYVFAPNNREDVLTKGLDLSNLERYEYWYSKPLLAVSDTLEELTTFVSKSITNSTLSDGMKVYIDSSFCSFPSLLLSRLDTTLKRVTDPKKADVIICDNPQIRVTNRCGIIGETDLVRHSSDGDSPVIVWQKLFYDFSDPKLCDQEVLHKTYDAFIKVINADKVYYCIEVTSSEKDVVKKLTCLNQKVVDTHTFINFVEKNLPVLEGEELNNICNMLQSTDQESYLAAVNMLPYYNIHDCIYDIITTLWLNPNRYLHRCTAGTGRSEKYMYYRISGKNNTDFYNPVRYDTSAITLLKMMNGSKINASVQQHRNRLWNAAQEVIQDDYFTSHKLNQLGLKAYLVKREEPEKPFVDASLRVMDVVSNCIQTLTDRYTEGTEECISPILTKLDARIEIRDDTD